MPRLLDLPTELLENIWEFVSRNDIDSFMLSCKLLHNTVRADRLNEHRMAKVRLKRIENSRLNLFGLPKLLQSFLLAPNMADYTKEMIVNLWGEHWYVVSEDEGEKLWVLGWKTLPEPLRLYPYPKSMMRGLTEAVEGSNLIPAEEKEFWSSETNNGNENPIIALLLPRLHYLTRLVIVFKYCEDLFILGTLHRITKDQNSPSLARLRTVEIVGTNHPIDSINFAIVCAALPSIISLSAEGLVEGPIDPAGPGYELAPRSSSVQNIRINDCILSQDILFNLIGSAKSLRSFAYISTRPDTYPPIAWALAALLQYASTSLEELTLHCPVVDQIWRTECSFRSYLSLRVLTIDYRLLMGRLYLARNKIVTLLPASIETLNLHGCSVFDDGKWVPDLVKWVARVKSRLVPCLKELNFMVRSFLYYYAKFQILDLCAIGLEAGITVTFTPDGELEYPG